MPLTFLRFANVRSIFFSVNYITQLFSDDQNTLVFHVLNTNYYVDYI